MAGATGESAERGEQSVTVRSLPRIGSPRVGAALLVAVPTVAVAVARAVANAPGASPAESLVGPLGVAALVGPALAALVLGVATQTPVVRAGAVCAGVFGLLGTVAGPALVPAVGAVAAGGTLALVAALRSRPVARERAVVLAAVPLVVAVSLTGALGVAPATLRPLGSSLAVVPVAALPRVTGARTADWAVGGLAAAATVAAGSAAPYVAGAVALVWGGYVGTSLPALALGVGGGLAGAFAAARRGAVASALAALALLAAGVPASVPRALAVLVAALVLAGGDPA